MSTMSDNEPDAATRAALAGDRDTGKVGAKPMASVAPDTLPVTPKNPDPAHNDPARASTDLEDAGWEPEEPGSILGNEREGIPQGDMPEQVGDEYSRTRAQTPPDAQPGRGKASDRPS